MRTRHPALASLVAALLCLSACGGDKDDAGATDSGATDASSSDTGTSTDADTGTNTGSDSTGGAGDALADASGGACIDKAPPALQPDPSRKRFAMSLFHYNLEYVIGGLDYTDKSGKQHLFVGIADAAGWDNDKVEDWIVTESFDPILAMYDKHPTWGVTIELQGYMIEVLAKRHPESLKLLRKLAQRGQVELVSFHYAAQLFLAFPREDLERSIARTKAIFKAHCLPLSGVVFNQEGQAGEGRQKTLVDLGYTIGVHPKNLWKYVRGDAPWWPWYASEGGTLIVGPGGVDPKSGVEVGWDFFDDGELRAVKGKLNPYFAPVAGHDPARVKEFEDKLAAREKAGWHMATIADYVAHLEAKKIEKKPAPPLLDGTWQPPSTESIHRWLGGRSDAFSGDEEDNRVRSGNAQASLWVRTCQVLLDQADKAGKATVAHKAEMAALWDLLWHAEVSDCSGVNPWRGEVLFGIEANAELLTRTKTLRAQLASALDLKPHVEVDLKARAAKALSDLPTGEPPTPTDPPFAVTIVAHERKVEATWHKSGDGRVQLTIGFSKAGEGPKCSGDCDPKRLAVDFPRLDDTLRYSPALIEDEVRAYPLADFTFTQGEAWLPLANGLIGLGKTKGAPESETWWVVKWTRSGHIAARVAPADKVIRFEDEAIQPDGTATWVFEVFQATPADALEVANRINLWPVVRW